MPSLILTTDEPDSLELRNELRPIHLDYLIAHQDKLLAGGALLSDDGSGGHGGCIIVDTEDRAEAEALIQNDPFTKGGLFADIKVTRWRKAFFNGEKCI